jgi:hypothetical protein
MRRVSMSTRDELLAAVSERYRASRRADKKTIIDEFAAMTGYHRKHAMRVLRTGPSAKWSAPRPSRHLPSCRAGGADCAVGGIGPCLRQATEGDHPNADRGDGATWSSGAGNQGADGAFEDERG